MISGRNVTVLGAGIGGLAVAIALARHGAKVRVLEQAPVIREVGAGLQISPNGLAVLRGLGLEAALAERSLAASAVDLRDGETGGVVTRLDLHRAAAAGQFRFVHRADLIELLEVAARGAGVEILLGQKVLGVTCGASRTRIALADGTHEGGLVIGADGLHSPTRAALNGMAAPFFTGQVAWRAIIPAHGNAEPIAKVFMGAGRHLVTYPLRGGQYRNIIAVEERARWVEESWSMTDDPLALRIAFEGFVPEVRNWLDQIERPNLWGLFRHPLAARWHGPGVALLGDAAHPTLPFLAQGANLALEDAWVLADCLSRAEEGEALAAYQERRFARVARAIAAANDNARNYHLAGARRTLAHMGLRLIDRLAPGATINRFRWLYGCDVTKSKGQAARSTQTGT